jgi:hypothetical protein
LKAKRRAQADKALTDKQKATAAHLAKVLPAAEAQAE